MTRTSKALNTSGPENVLPVCNRQTQSRPGCQLQTGNTLIGRKPCAVVLVLLLSVFTLLAQPATSSNRFLFIVDVSSGMKSFDKSVRDSVFDLIFSGVRGYMTNGDTYGLWLVNDRNETSFPMESWKSKFAVEIATKATLHVKERGFKGKSRLDLAFTDALRVIENVGDLTIILVSNGDTPVRGTPFDEKINAAFAELAPTMRRAKSALNTTLIAQDGKLMGWAVNSPEFLIRIPEVPPRPKPVKTEVAEIKTNAASLLPTNSAPVVKAAPEEKRYLGVPSAPAPVEPVAPQSPPRIASNPIIITRESVAEEKASYRALSTTSTNTSTDVTATNIVATKSSNAESVATNAVAIKTPSNTVPSTTITSAPAVAVSSSNSPAKTDSVPSLATNGIAVVTTEKNSNTIAVTAAEQSASTNQVVADVSASQTIRLPKVAIPSTPLSSWMIVVIASVCGGVVAVLVLFLLRTRKREPSLISRAAARERMSNAHSPS